MCVRLCAIVNVCLRMCVCVYVVELNGKEGRKLKFINHLHEADSDQF